MHLFSPNIFGKSLNILTLAFGFLFFIALLGGQFIIYFNEKDNSKYFMKDFKVSIQSIWFTTFHIGILNFCFGACHLLMQNQPSNQLVVLSIIEVVYITFLTMSLKSNKVYKKKYVGWQYAMASLIRIGLIFTFTFGKDIDE